MTNIILVRLETAKSDMLSPRADMEQNPVVSSRVDSNVLSIARESERLNKFLESKSAASAASSQSAMSDLGVPDRDTAEERQDILAWISTLSFQEKQRNVFSKHHKGTREWLLQSPLFQRWFKGRGNSTMWCPGDRELPSCLCWLQVLIKTWKRALGKR